MVRYDLVYSVGLAHLTNNPFRANTQCVDGSNLQCLRLLITPSSSHRPDRTSRARRHAQAVLRLGKERFAVLVLDSERCPQDIEQRSRQI